MRIVPNDYVWIDQHGTLYRMRKDKWLELCRECADGGKPYSVDNLCWRVAILKAPPKGIGKRRVGRGWSEWLQLAPDTRLVRCLDWTPADFAAELDNISQKKAA